MYIDEGGSKRKNYTRPTAFWIKFILNWDCKVTYFPIVILLHYNIFNLELRRQRRIIRLSRHSKILRDFFFIFLHYIENMCKAVSKTLFREKEEGIK